MIKQPPAPLDIDFGPALPPGPFIHTRPLRWGETDAAQIAYTGYVPAILLEAIESWVKACLGVNWFELNIDLGVGMPFVHMDCDFKSPITPYGDLGISVRIDRVGKTSLHFIVSAKQNQKTCVTGRFSCVFVDVTEMSKIPIPARMRRNILTYQEKQDHPPAG